MPHFVSVPPDKTYWVPKLTELSLLDLNGTASIAVWGMPAGSTVQAENNARFVAKEYRQTGDLRFFYLRGLIAGDKIAAFLPDVTTPTGSTVYGNQFTGWLPIKLVKGDRHAKERDLGLLPRSKFKQNFILDAHGSEQRHPPVPESLWLKTVDETILKIRGNAIGAQVLGGIVKDLVISPYIPPDKNAFSSVTFTPQSWRGSEPGAKADEVLCHEFVHVLENDFDGYVDNPTDGLKYDGSDFLTVTVANMYASLNGRPLRADHQGFNSMPVGYASNPASFKTANAGNFTSIKNRLPAYSRLFANFNTPWNPFR